MRILFYLHRYPAIGGIENVTTFLANAFAGLGHEIRIFSHFGVTDCAEGLNDAIGVARLDRGRVLRREIGTWKPDLVVYQDSYAPIEKMLFYPGMNVPVIVCEHNAPFFCYAEPNISGKWIRDFVERLAFPVVRQLKYLRDRARRRYLYSRCWRYVLLSDRYFGEFRAVARIGDSRKLRAVPNAVSASNRGETHKQNEILFVGAVGRRKGCDRLIEIWRQLAPKYQDWSLTVVGGGPLKDILEQEVKNKGIPRVSFEGWQADPGPYFDRAKIFCLPSKREGWPLVLCEAQSRGCVPIAYESYSAVRDIIDSGKNGVLVPAFDEHGLMHALEELMAAQDAWAKMSEAGRESATRNSPVIVLEHWRHLLGELRDSLGVERHGNLMANPTYQLKPVNGNPYGIPVEKKRKE